MVRIAAVQFYTDLQDAQKNFKKAEEYLKKAKEANAELIIFPEFFLGGPKMVVENARERLVELAKKYEIDMVSGSYGEKVGDITYNCSSYIDKDGNILLNYRKMNIWGPEAKRYTAGDGYHTVKTRFGFTIGIAICWDLAFSDGFTEMVMNQGAELICVPTYWGFESGVSDDVYYDIDSEYKFIDSLCTARGFEYGIVMVFVNGAAVPSPPPPPNSPVLTLEQTLQKIKPERFGVIAGHTQITASLKGVLAKCDHLYEDMLVHDVDVKKFVKDAESLYQLRKSWESKKVKKNDSRL